MVNHLKKNIFSPEDLPCMSLPLIEDYSENIDGFEDNFGLEFRETKIKHSLGLTTDARAPPLFPL